MTAARMIEVREVGFRYPAARTGREPRGLRNVSFEVAAGEIVIVTGPSGSGKSTLCRCLNGLIPHADAGAMEGEVIIAGMNTRDHPVAAIASRVGMVFQDPDHQLFSSDVEAEIAFGLEQRGLPGAAMEPAVEGAIRALGIAHLRERPLGELSWGERQRVAIASVVAMQPEVLILDEPFSGIDDPGARYLTDLLSRLSRERGMTIILTEHRLERVRPLLRRLIVLHEGGVLHDKTMPDGAVAGDPFPPFFGKDPGSPCGRRGSRRPLPCSGRCRCPFLVLDGVSASYPRSRRAALAGVNLEIFAGEILVITGPNGSGKSTLIRHLNGLLRPAGGVVRVEGDEIGERDVAEVSRKVGVLLQHADYQLFEETIADELAFAPSNFGLSADATAARTREVAGLLGIGSLGLSTPPLQLSVGEKQRVAIGGLLMMDAPAVVLDEPTLGLDKQLKCDLASILLSLRNDGKAVVVATHDHEFADLVADRVVGMEAGAIVRDDRLPPPAGGDAV